MGSLVQVLYPVPDFRRTPLSLLRWWESRRLVYNTAVGGAGLVTLSAALLVGPPTGLLQAAGFAAAYGLAANACYSMGWGLELLATRVWGRRAPDVGPVLFRQGLIFSVGLTLLPLLPLSLFGAARVVMAVLGWLS